MNDYIPFILQIISYLFVGYGFYHIGELRGYKEGCSDLKDKILEKYNLKEK